MDLHIRKNIMDEEVIAFIRNLPDKQRTILLLRAIGNFTFREIEKLTKTNSSTARSLYQQATEKLNNEFGWDWIDEH